MGDQEILTMYRQRDENAIAETRRKYGGLCRTIAENVLGDRRDAEECVQDAYMAVWDRVPPDEPRSLRAYIGRITRNLAVSIYRRNRASKRYDPMETMLSELDDCVPSDSDPQRTVERRELGRAISYWLDGLKEDDRRLFIRRYWYGDSVETVARDADLRPNTAAQRLRRLRASLAAYLAAQGF